MIEYNGKQYRNLEEQVLANQYAIEEIHDVGLLLAQLGIKVVGQVANEAALPDASTYYADEREAHYGDAYAVGTLTPSTPYEFYIFTRPFIGPDPDDPVETQPEWFKIGKFPWPGPKGDSGEGPTNPSSFNHITFAPTVDISNQVINGTMTFVMNDTYDTFNVPYTMPNPTIPGSGLKVKVNGQRSELSTNLYRHYIVIDENNNITGEGDYSGMKIEFFLITDFKDSMHTIQELFTYIQRANPGKGLTLPATGSYNEPAYSGGSYSNYSVINTITLKPNGESGSAGPVFAVNYLHFVPNNYDDPLHVDKKTFNSNTFYRLGFSDTVQRLPDASLVTIPNPSQLV